jgi:hypothetical protein
MTSSEYFLSEDDENPNEKWFVLNGTWKDSYTSIILSEGIKLFRIANPLWYNESSRDLSFLKELHFLEGIQIYCDQEVNLDHLYSLNQLKRLSLVDCSFSGKFDLSQFKLKELSLSYSKQFIGLSSQSEVEKLFIERVDNDTFKELSFKYLTYLKLYNSPALTDISPIQSGAKINHIEFYNCRQLISLEALKHCSNLKVLAIDKCKSVYELSSLEDHISLKFFRIESCGDVKTLKPLLSCPNLERIAFIGKGVLIEDGDFSKFMQMDSLVDFRFQNRRSYKPKFQDFREWSWEKAKQHLESRDIWDWKIINVREDEATMYIQDVPFFGILSGSSFELNEYIKCKVLSYTSNKTIQLRKS